MEQTQYPSQILAQAVKEISNLPGIGKKSALRLALHLLKQDKTLAHNLANAIINLADNIVYCQHCHNISDTPTCTICANPSRDHSTICVVEGMQNVLTIEHTQQYRGTYHVLGALISPMDGIGPNQINIPSLIQRVQNNPPKEIIFALSATMEGDTTNFYLYKKLQPFNINISIIARGIPIGDELEYTDEITLGRSIINRTPFTLNQP